MVWRARPPTFGREACAPPSISVHVVDAWRDVWATHYYLVVAWVVLLVHTLEIIIGNGQMYGHPSATCNYCAGRTNVSGLLLDGWPQLTDLGLGCLFVNEWNHSH